LLFISYTINKEFLRSQELRGVILMNLAKVSANGQVTVPIEIRRRLKLKEGDKILFIERENGEIVINNASATAILKAQKAFEGVAGKAGIQDEEQVQALVDEVRYERDSK
jgi:antitoxin PrlF